MKFEKFVKSLGGHGVIYNRGDDEKWLASTTMFMRIPETSTGIIADSIATMPKGINDIINYDTANDPCELFKAVMPNAHGAIKDCIRIFASENNVHEIAIRNNDFALIEKGDVVEIHSRYNKKEELYESKALIVKRYVSHDEEPEIIGIVFAKEYSEEEGDK